MFHCSMEHRCEAKGNPRLIEALSGLGSRQTDVYTERLQDICGAAGTGDTSVPVLCDIDSTGSGNECSCGADIERVESIASGSARVQQRRPQRRDSRSSGPHCHRSPNYFIRNGTLRGHCCEKCSNIDWLAQPIHNGSDTGGGFIASQMLLMEQGLDGSGKLFMHVSSVCRKAENVHLKRSVMESDSNGRRISASGKESLNELFLVKNHLQMRGVV